MILIPALVMFTITVAVVAVFLIPATYERTSPLVNFYWVGTWLFLALITAVAGGEQTVMMLGAENNIFAKRLLAALVVCFPLFIVFGWFRLAGAAALAGLRRIRR